MIFGQADFGEDCIVHCRQSVEACYQRETTFDGAAGVAVSSTITDIAKDAIVDARGLDVLLLCTIFRRES